MTDEPTRNAQVAEQVEDAAKVMAALMKIPKERRIETLAIVCAAYVHKEGAHFRG